MGLLVPDSFLLERFVFDPERCLEGMSSESDSTHAHY